MFTLRWGQSAFVLAAIALFISLGGTGYALNRAEGAPPTDSGARPHTALPAWRTLTLTGGWQNGGYDSFAAGYYKDSQSVVHLRGSAAKGNTAQAVFQLPTKSRPSHTLWLQIYANNGQTGGLKIKPDGTAWLFDNVGGANVTVFTSLDGISFRVP